MRRASVVLWGVILTGGTVWSWTAATNGITRGWGADPVTFVIGILYLILASFYTLLIGWLLVNAFETRRRP